MQRFVALFASVALMVCGVAVGQETTGAIIGSVQSQDGEPLPGVTLRLVDPDTGLERTAVADRTGRYKLVALPPGRYQITASLDGFQTVKRAIRVDLGRTVTNDVEMALGAFTNIVEVTGEAPLVDVTSTVTGLTVKTDELNSQLPIVREVTQLSLLAPGSLAGDTAFSSQSEYSESTPGQDLVSVGGASVAENSYQLNGLNITNFRTGVGSSMIPFEFVDEVQIKTGGYEAEFGRSTGGVVNMITKSGTNTTRGTASLYFQPEGLQEQEPNTYNRYNEVETLERLEANASLGGAIVGDRLFYFLFVNHNDVDELRVGSGRGNWLRSSEPYYGGKLDWNITPSHRLEATYFSDSVEVDQIVRSHDPEAGFGDDAQSGLISRGGDNWIGKYTGVLTNNFLLSVQYGSNDFDRTNRSSADDCPYVVDSRTGTDLYIGCWVNWSRGFADDRRDAYRVDLDWFVGNHSLRGGVDSEDSTSGDLTEFSGDVFYRYYMNGTEEQDPSEYVYPELPYDTELARLYHYSVGGSYDTLSGAAYLQDSWAVTPKLTVNLGLRYEKYDNRNALGDSYIKITDQWAPRVGAVWDPAGNGRSKLFGSYGVYHLPIASNTNIRQAGAEYFDVEWYTYSGGIDPVTAEPGQLDELLDHYLYSDGEVPDTRLTRSDSVDPMSQQELILGYERMVSDAWSLGARFVAREFQEVIEDISLDRALYYTYGADYPMMDLCYNPDSPWFGACAIEYRLTNPGTDFSGWVDLDFDGVLDPVAFTAAELGYPEPERKYYAVELTARKRFADNWMLQGSYTWSHSYGNYEGYVNSDLGQDDAGITESFDQPGLMEHSRGNLPNDRRHNLKIYGVYAWDLGFQLGANFWFQTGRPINGFGVHPTDPWAQTYGNYSFYNNGEQCPRGCAGETDDSWSLDLSAKYDFTTGPVDWFLRVDVFNVLDNDAVIEIREFAELVTGAPDPNYLEATHHQTPRRVRFGVGISF